MNRALRTWTSLLGVGGLLAVAWATSVLSSPELNRVPVPGLITTGTPGLDDATIVSDPATATASSEPPQTEVTLPNERTGLIAIIVLTIVVCAVGVVAWLVVRRRLDATRANPLMVQRPGARRGQKRTEEVVAAIDAGISQLADLDADPRGAVIACWVRLEQAAAAVGTPRQVGDSPTDLVTRLLRTHEVSPAVLEGLAAVYLEARFATHTIDDRMRSAAVAALGQVRSDLQHESPSRRPPLPVGKGASADLPWEADL